MQTGSSGELRSPVGAADTRGKHRVSAELKRLEQETRFLELFCSTFLNVRNPTPDSRKPSIYKTIYNSDPSPPFYFEHFGSPNLSARGVCVNCNSTEEICRMIIQPEELEQLEKMEKASAACKEMLSNIETRPDPLLPVTNGPINPIWDRWFEGPQDSSGCRCRIL